MRKTVFVLLAALMLLSGCTPAEETENPYRLKTYVIESYMPDGSSRVTKAEYSYDEKGFVTDILTFQDEEFHHMITYIRDAYGNILSTETSYSDKTQISEKNLTLDHQHRVIYSESFQNGELYATTEYGYGEDGQITKLYINRIDALNGQDWKSYVDRTYDRMGNLIREDTRWEPDHNNSGSSYNLYTYQGQKLLRVESYSAEKLLNYTDYTYDHTGLIQTAITCQEDGTLHAKRITTFDKFGNQLEVVSYAYHHDLVVKGEADEEPDSRTTYIYELHDNG